MHWNFEGCPELIIVLCPYADLWQITNFTKKPREHDYVQGGWKGGYCIPAPRPFSLRSPAPFSPFPGPFLPAPRPLLPRFPCLLHHRSPTLNPPYPCPPFPPPLQGVVFPFYMFANVCFPQANEGSLFELRCNNVALLIDLHVVVVSRQTSEGFNSRGLVVCTPLINGTGFVRQMWNVAFLEDLSGKGCLNLISSYRKGQNFSVSNAVLSLHQIM